MAHFGPISFLTFFCILGKLDTVVGITAILDVESDARFEWKIEGYSLYIKKGNQLRGPLSQFLPEKFQFPNFDLTKGIWAVIPKGGPCTEYEQIMVKDDDWNLFASEETSDSSGEIGQSERKTAISTTTTRPTCYSDASASFHFDFSDQLVSSVSVRYSFGGNATIVIKSNSKPYHISAEGQFIEDWVDLHKHIAGSQMTLEAYVHGKGDYILIDKIIVESLEPSTSPRTTKSPKTTPIPTIGGQDGLAVTSKTFLMSFVFTVLIYNAFVSLF